MLKNSTTVTFILSPMSLLSHFLPSWRCVAFAACLGFAAMAGAQVSPLVQLELTVAQDLASAAQKQMRQYFAGGPNPQSRHLTVDAEVDIISENAADPAAPWRIKTVYLRVKHSASAEVHRENAERLRSFTAAFLKSKGYTLDEARRDAPLAVMSFTRVQPEETLRREVTSLMTKLAIASFILFLLMLLRSKKAEALLTPPRRPEPAVEIPSLVAAPEASAAAPPNLAPPPVAPAAVNADPLLKLHPGAGTWYLHALPDASRTELHRAFSQIKYQDALALLNNLPPRRRQEIIERMELTAPIRRKIEGENPTVLTSKESHRTEQRTVQTPHLVSP